MAVKRGRIGISLVVAGMFILLVVAWCLLLPEPLFDVSYSTVVTDREGKIVGMTVAGDGQFRVPGESRLSLKYVAALLTFEDKYFPVHHGVDPLAIARALWLNFTRGRIVSGGSTLTMQVVRLSRGNPPRTVGEKLREMILALRLEQHYTKREILDFYAAHAPFGGNIVGIEAAALKYFGHRPDELSWAEAALLAVLPNAPALIYPGKNNAGLKAKRDGLLRRLREDGFLTWTDLRLAVAEPLPERMFREECIVPHLLARASQERPGQLSRSCIDSRLQERVNSIVERHIGVLKHNYIYNAAVMVVHVPTGEIRAYVGNAPAVEGGSGEQVDVIMSPRSSGSILKPALYALMLEDGYILPGMLVSDVPSRFGSYAPVNFSKDYLGVVPASRALAMSLNVPFVRLLRDYGVEHFYDKLKLMGVSTLTYPAGHYGLSLILGGAECRLWDLCCLYGGLASTVRHYNENDGQYFNHEYRRLKLWVDECVDSVVTRERPVGAGAAWLTLEALRDVERPDMESGWKNFASSIDLSWKTGTSFGFRDAWAVGVNADYVIGVWVGNADGVGRPGLVGVRAAAPLLFEVAALTRTIGRLERPDDDLVEIPVCRKSGYRLSGICPEADTVSVPRPGVRTPVCPYHRWIHVDRSGRYRVNSEHESVYAMKRLPWFVLTPVQEWYYARTHADYRKLPPFREDCRPVGTDVMEIIYPRQGVQVFIPRDLGGITRGVVFEVAHREPGVEVFWHIDDSYVGSTRYRHQLEVNLPPGRHVLYLVDEYGNTLSRSFTVVENS